MKKRNWLDLVRPKSFEKSATGLITTATLEPLERGFGFTIGTALRRVVLSSIPGAAVTAMRFECATFDGSRIEGIEEPLEAVILNLKQLAFCIDETFQSGRLRVALDKPGLLTSGDIVHIDGLNAVDPNQPVCTVINGTPAALEIFIATGYGYVPNSAQPEAHVPAGFTAIDTVHSPVRRATYTVEPTRLGHMLDYDRLVLTIETNGTISGEEALRRAAGILHDQLSVFINFEEEFSEPEEPRADPPGFDPVLLQRLDELELSVRASNCMKNENIVYIGDLVTRTEAQLLRIPNFGRKTLHEIKVALAALGLGLAADLPGWPPADIDGLASHYQKTGAVERERQIWTA